MTTLVPDSAKLREELGQLPPAEKATIRAKRHPWLGRPRMVRLVSVAAEGEAVIAELARRHGVCRWERGAWRVKREQLRLPGF